MKNFLVSSKSFREYSRDGRVHWRNFVQIVFDNMDDSCQCPIKALVRQASYERTRKIMKMIQYAHAWLMANDEEKGQLEQKIIDSTARGESKRYREHMLRGINCLKKDGIRNFEDVERALEKGVGRGKRMEVLIPEVHERMAKSLKQDVLTMRELEEENESLKAKLVECFDENEILKKVIDRSNLQFGRFSRELEEMKRSLILEKEASARLRQENKVFRDLLGSSARKGGREFKVGK